VLSGIRDRVEGTLAVSLIGLDGIAIDTVNQGQVPLDVLGAEFGGFIKSVRPNAELDTGEVLQFSLVTEKYITFLSAVTPEYFILLVLQPDGNYGRARFELSKAKNLLRDELI
jgi:predicted regulator of Ras-like GTPase activity (Roadblock/LC7/MglB family)